MKPILLCINTVAMNSEDIFSSIINCMFQTGVHHKNIDNICYLPSNNMTPLCQALYAAADIPDHVPVLITTSERLPGFFPAEISLSGLVAGDDGWLFFHRADFFRHCAMNAIRAYDPTSNIITLTDCWNQALLSTEYHL